LGVGLTTPLCKTWICFKTSTEASESGGRTLGSPWPENGPKRNRRKEEEEEKVLKANQDSLFVLARLETDSISRININSVME
jgi:hypothetical protein